MKSIHLVVPDLFLSKDMAEEASFGLHLPFLEKLLGRGSKEILPPVSMEYLLCESFGVACDPDIPVAPISAVYDGLVAGDGLAEGCWLRADPVHLQLQRSHLLAADVQVNSDEAKSLCASLNDHFSGDVDKFKGIEFHAPHPQRWYVRLDKLPNMRCTPLSQVIGNDVRFLLPSGEDASVWHQIFNEIQMLLFAHPLNEAREARGELPINSVWLWGGGDSSHVSFKTNFGKVCSDDVLAEMFAKAAGISNSDFHNGWSVEQDAEQLLVWTGLRTALQHGGLPAWRDAIQDFEKNNAGPVWRALRTGKVETLQLDILVVEKCWRVMLKRRDAWAFWKRSRPFASYFMV